MNGAEGALLRAALHYAACGVAVFPCHPGTKQPLLAADRDADGREVRGTGGLKKATTDASVISAWWKRYSKAAIGVPTGKSLGAVVVDLDAGTDPDTGEHFTAEGLLADLEREIETKLPTTRTSQTPRGGLHLFFGIAADEPMPANRTAVLPRIDVRGEGGYVIVPPSRRSDGREYVWLGAGLEEPLAPAPPALLDLILRRGRWSRDRQAGNRQATQQPDELPPRGSAQGRKQYGAVALDGQLRQLREAPPGTRNNTLFVSARKLGQLVAAGVLNLQDVRAGLEQAIRPWPNLRKSLATLDRGLEQGLSEPREIPESTGSISKAAPSPRTVAEPRAVSAPTPLDEKLAHLDATDRGNASRFVERNRQKFRHCDKTGWLWWSDGHWSHEGADAAVLRAVHETVDAIKTESTILESNRGQTDDVTSEEAADLG